MNRILIIPVFLFLFLITAADAEVNVDEVWICQDSADGDWTEILVTAKVPEGDEAGTVEMDGVTHLADFERRNGDRRWVFGPAYNFTLIVTASGDAMYYDYSNGARGRDILPKMFFFCKQRAPYIKKPPYRRFNNPEDMPPPYF